MTKTATAAVLKKGEVLSETQFYTVVNFNAKEVELKPDSGEAITVSRAYLDKFLVSGEQFTDSQKVNKTEAANLLLSNPNVAMTVCYRKQIDQKDVQKEILEAIENSTPKNLPSAISSALSKGIDGELRVITGRHSSHVNELGRLTFIDMKLPRDASKSYDSRTRLVDPRTIEWLVVNGVKYTVK